MRRRELIGAIAALTGCSRAGRSVTSAAPAPSPTFAPATYVADARRLADHLEREHVTLPSRAIDWPATRSDGLAQVQTATDPAAFLAAIERLCDALYDPQLRVRPAQGPTRRRLPADIVLEEVDGAFEVDAVRRGSAAAAAGLRAGQRVTAFDGEPLAERIGRFRPAHGKGHDPRRDAFARAAAVAGVRGAPRRFAIVEGTTRRTIEVPADDPDPSPPVSTVTEDDLAIIRLSALDETVADAFDAALAPLRDTAGLLLDLRGCMAVAPAAAERVLGRFVEGRSRYASKAARDGDGLEAPWPVYVNERGPWPYEGRVVVIVDRFTAGAPEDLAAALQGLGRASVVGPPTAGWSTHTRAFVLPNTRVSVEVPYQKLFGVDGIARDRWTPDVPLSRDEDVDARAREILRRDIRRNE